ncbi:MAG: hypothetical protein QXU18_09815 [Thermoplasmatales archaeon]
MIKVDMENKPVLSSTKKSWVIASTEGYIVAHQHKNRNIRVNLNVCYSAKEKEKVQIE